MMVVPRNRPSMGDTAARGYYSLNRSLLKSFDCERLFSNPGATLFA